MQRLLPISLVAPESFISLPARKQGLACVLSSLYPTQYLPHTQIPSHTSSTMGLIKGGFLRLVQTALYAVCFCCAAIVLGMSCLHRDATRGPC